MKRCVFVGILSCHYTAHTKFSEQSPFQGSCHTRSYARTRTRHKPQEHGCRDVACWLGSELPETIHGFLTAILPIEINENTAQHFCG